MKKKMIKSMSVFFLLAIAMAVIFFADRQKSPWEKGTEMESGGDFFPVANMNGVYENKSDDYREIVIPLDRAGERISRKPFGIFITPQNSPVEAERFSGFHTGTDFEVFPEEIDREVEIRAVCDGKIETKRSASGYGGVISQSCQIDNEDVMIVYGHLDLGSVSKKIGDEVMRGEGVGFLGKGFSLETDGERKHLHLAIHKGEDINILGYVQNEKDLSDWIDPCKYFCQ